MDCFFFLHSHTASVIATDMENLQDFHSKSQTMRKYPTRFGSHVLDKKKKYRGIFPPQTCKYISEVQIEEEIPSAEANYSVGKQVHEIHCNLCKK